MIEVRRLCKSFGATMVVDHLTLTVPVGSRLAILGPSASGKTTLLRLLAGLESPDSGEIDIAGVAANRNNAVLLPPAERSIGFAFQTPALWPHLSVLGNVRFGIARLPRRQARARALEMLRRVGIDDLADKRPGQLSGGQQRRVGLARALAPEPRRLLLDEPLTSLDHDLRQRLLELIDSAVTTTGASLLYVTHDRDEAVQLTARILELPSPGHRDGSQ